MKSAYLIINPKAGKSKSKADIYNIISEMSFNEIEVSVVFTMYGGHARTLAENAAKRNFDMIVCYGGDGTLNEVASGIIASGKDIPIGYIPAGSTNDFALSLKIPVTAIKAVRNIINGVPVSVDVGEIDERNFMYIASFGAFTSVSYNTSQEIKNVIGHFAYVLQGIRDIASITSYHVKVTSGSRSFEGDYIFGAVGNSKSIGGIIKLRDELVSMNDGEFEVLLIKPPKTPIDINNIIMGLGFSDFSDSMFEFFKAKEITVETEDNFNWSLDGEFYEGKEKVTIKNIHDRMKILKTGE